MHLPNLHVVGKGDKERIVPFGRRARRALLDYLARRGEEVPTEYVFVDEYGNPILLGSVRDNMQRYGKIAGITGVRVSPHTCRHTFAKNWIRNGGDVFSLQVILGHTTLEMCRHYVALASEDVQNAHRIHSPVDRLLGESSDKRKQKGRKRLR